MKHLFFILFIYLNLHCISAAPHLSRNYAYRYYSTRDGLAQMQVLCAFQDRDGYMWFGTKGGVSRYDGVSFKNYTQDDGISVGAMFSVGEWGQNKLFFFANQFQILHENDSLELVQLPDSLIFSNNNFFNIELSNSEILLLNLTNSNNLSNIQNNCHHLIWNKNTRMFRLWKSVDKLIFEYNDHFILTSNALYSRSGINVKKLQTFPNKYSNGQVNWKNGDAYLYNIVDKRIEEHKLIGNKLHFKQVIISNVLQSQLTLLPNKSILYFGSNKQPYTYPKLSVDIKPDLAYLEKVYVDREGNLWITSNNGLYNFFNCLSLSVKLLLLVL